MQLSVLLAAVAAASAQIDLSGSWLFDASYVEGYTISNTTIETSWLAHCALGPCTSWKTAEINITNESNGACVVRFDFGLVHNGTVLGNGFRLQWQDGSSWRRSLNPGTEVNVHLLPHSHNDPGWKSTMEELYNSSIRQIYTAFVTELAANPSRTYAAEIAVFWSLWWEDPLVNDTLKQLAQQAVANGQMEFIGSGWTQNDEATVTFYDTINQMTLGHLWTRSTLGSGPITTAWQADPFGHSTTQAYAYTLMAMDGYVFGRPMQDDPITTTQSAALWHPMASFPDNGSFDPFTLLTHDQVFGYWEPYRDLHNALVAGNVSAVVAGLASAIATIASHEPILSTQVILFGDDFAWFDANAVYATLDKALAALNGTTGVLPGMPNVTVNIKYSTPSRWIKALAAELATNPGHEPISGGSGRPKAVAGPSTALPARPAWDMMPLIGCEFPDPWTGFYTSRPEFKGLFRLGSAVLRAAGQAHALVQDAQSWLQQSNMLSVLWKAVGLVQHHDATTGDSYDYVMEDFGAYIRAGLSNASSVLGSNIASLQASTATPAACFNASALPCPGIYQPLQNGQPSTVTVYNPTGWVRDEWVEVVVSNALVVVTDGTTGAALLSQITSTVSGWVPAEYGPGPWYSLVFQASSLPPLGYNTYVLSPAPSASSPGVAALCTRSVVSPDPTPGWLYTVTAPGGSPLRVSFNASGVLQLLEYNNGPVVPAVTVVRQYTSVNGAENAWDFTTQGKGPESALPFPGAANAVFTATSTAPASCPLFAEVVTDVDLASTVRTRYRVYSGTSLAATVVHVYTTTGPFPFDNLSHDPILRVETGLASNSTFFTDSNSLELLPRVRDARPWWNQGPYVDAKDPVTGNYYPVTAGILLTTAEGTSVGVLTGPSDGLGSSQGGTSMADGTLEVIVNRMVLAGGDAVQQPTSVTGNRTVTVHNVLLARNSWAEMTTDFRTLQVQHANPVVVLAVQSMSPGAYPTVPKPTWSGLTQPLPSNVELFGLQLLPPGANITMSAAEGLDPSPSQGVLVARVRHIYGQGEGDSAVNGTATVDLNMFTPWSTQGGEEMTATLTRSMQSARAQQVQWPQAASGMAAALPQPHAEAKPQAPTQVGLSPMALKSFVLEVSKS